MNPFKSIASVIGSATTWSVKKSLGIKPMFDLKYYQGDWDSAGVKLYQGWTDLGSNLGIRDSQAPPVLLHPDTPPPVPEAPPRVIQAAERMIDAATQTAQVGVALGTAGAQLGAKSAVALTDLAKTTGLKAGILVVGTAAQGWNKLKGLKEKLLAKKEVETPEETVPAPQERKMKFDPETNTWVPEEEKISEEGNNGTSN